MIGTSRLTDHRPGGVEADDGATIMFDGMATGARIQPVVDKLLAQPSTQAMTSATNG